MRTLLTILLIGCFWDSFGAPTLQPEDDIAWQFSSSGHPVAVRLTSSPSTLDHRLVYSLQIIAKNASPTVGEEAAFLDHVTDDMDKRGMPPNRIVAMSLELCEPEVSKGLAIAAQNSQTWSRTSTSDQGAVVVSLLNSMGAYKQFNSVFGRYGLVVEVSHAEYISTAKPESLGLKQSDKSELPIGASLELILHKKDVPRRGH